MRSKAFHGNLSSHNGANAESHLRRHPVTGTAEGRYPLAAGRSDWDAPGMELSPATLADTDRITALYQAYDEEEMGDTDMDATEVQLQLDEPDSVNVLAHDGERLVGYAHLAPLGDLETVTDPADPEFRDQQGWLLDWVIAQATDLPQLNHWTGARPDGAGALLADRGFRHVRTSWRMRRLLGAAFEPAPWPDGVQVRPFVQDRDAESVWALVQLGFAGTYGSRRRTLAEWSRLFLGPGTDAVCAYVGSDLIGAVLLSPRETTGYIPQVVVHPEHRGQGLALAMLHEAFRRFAALGLDTTLSVDGENDGASRVYRKAGMQADSTYRQWQRG